MYGEHNITSLAALLPSAGVSSLNTGAIVGGTVGGTFMGIVAVLLLIPVVFCSYKKCCKVHNNTHRQAPPKPLSVMPMIAASLE